MKYYKLKKITMTSWWLRLPLAPHGSVKFQINVSVAQKVVHGDLFYPSLLAWLPKFPGAWNGLKMQCRCVMIVLKQPNSWQIDKFAWILSGLCGERVLMLLSVGIKLFKIWMGIVFQKIGHA